MEEEINKEINEPTTKEQTKKFITNSVLIAIVAGIAVILLALIIIKYWK